MSNIIPKAPTTTPKAPNTILKAPTDGLLYAHYTRRLFARAWVTSRKAFPAHECIESSRSESIRLSEAIPSSTPLALNPQ